jgi:hypothetical protein
LDHLVSFCWRDRIFSHVVLIVRLLVLFIRGLVDTLIRFHIVDHVSHIPIIHHLILVHQILTSEHVEIRLHPAPVVIFRDRILVCSVIVQAVLKIHVNSAKAVLRVHALLPIGITETIGRGLKTCYPITDWQFTLRVISNIRDVTLWVLSLRLDVGWPRAHV